ncbi:MAG: FtsX-like permease family protein [Gammaproteobacteria bacterium]|nr:FtsX-like permease family protein [Gammaproteobacteria bacterium]
MTTVSQRFTGNDRIPQIVVRADTIDKVPDAIEEVKVVVQKRHKNQDFFGIFDVRGGVKQLSRISTLIKITLGSIAGVSLLVGGIGVMNMMLVALGERMREIGLRKALGAKNIDILWQFLSESVLLCSIGGISGVGLGIFAGEGMAYIAVRIVKIVPQWPAVFSLQWALISISFAALLGVGFGLYPAIRAMHLSSIEALRLE